MYSAHLPPCAHTLTLTLQLPLSHSNAMEFELFDPPSDGITSLSFAPSTSTSSTNRRKFLLACSWDSSAYLYDASSNLPMGKWPVGSALLDGCFWGRDARGVAHAVGLSRQIHR